MEPMKIIRNKELDLRNQGPLIIVLGKAFSPEGSNLLNLLPGIDLPYRLLKERSESLKARLSFHDLTPEYCGLDDIPEDGILLVISPTAEDALFLRELPPRDGYLLVQSLELAYAIDREIPELNLNYVVPEPQTENPIRVVGLPDVENPFCFSALFEWAIPMDESCSVTLEQGLGVRPQSCLFDHFESAASVERKAYGILLKDDVPGLGLAAALSRFKERHLSTKEQIEKHLLLGTYGELPELIRVLLMEDQTQFPYVYEIICWLENKSPAAILTSILEGVIGYLVKGDSVFMDKTYLPLIYGKLAKGFLKLGKPGNAALAYKEFAGLSVSKESLKGIRSNFIRKELEAYALAGNLQAIIDGEETIRSAELNREDGILALNYLVLAWSGIGEDEKALKILDESGINNRELQFIQSLLLFNLDRLTIADLEERGKANRNGAMLNLYFDYLKVLLLARTGAAVDGIKVINGIGQDLESLHGRSLRRFQTTAALAKARAYGAIGKLRDSEKELGELALIHKGDLEGSIISLVGTFHQERTRILMDLGEFYLAKEVMGLGLASPCSQPTPYDLDNRFRLLIAQVDLLNLLGEEDSEAVASLEEAFGREPKEDWAALRLQALLTRVSHRLKDRPEEAVELAEQAWLTYNEDSDRKRSSILLEIGSLVRNHFRETDDADALEFWLKRMIGKFAGHEEDGLATSGGVLSMEMGDLLLASGRNEEALSVYGQFLLLYRQRGLRKLSALVSSALLKKAGLLYGFGRYAEGMEELLAIREKTDEEAYDLLRPRLEDGLKMQPESIDGYERYLKKHSHVDAPLESILWVCWRLAELFRDSGKDKTAIRYLDLILERDIQSLMRLEAMAFKGDILYGGHKDQALALYKEAVLRFKDLEEDGILEGLLSAYARLAEEMAPYDMELFRELVQKAVSAYDHLSLEARGHLYMTLKQGAGALEILDRLEDEWWTREQLTRILERETKMEQRLERAHCGYRILMDAIAIGSQEDIGRCFGQLEKACSGEEDPLIIEYLERGREAYGIDWFRRGNLEEGKRQLGVLDRPDARYYLGAIEEGLGNKERALERYGSILADGWRMPPSFGTIAQAGLSRIRLLKDERSMFGRKQKKLIREIEERLLPILDACGLEVKIEVLLELALLYRRTGRVTEGEEGLRRLVELYGSEGDYRVCEVMKKVYVALE